MGGGVGGVGAMYEMLLSGNSKGVWRDAAQSEIDFIMAMYNNFKAGHAL